jgi:hypothetical protein
MRKVGFPLHGCRGRRGHVWTGWVATLLYTLWMWKARMSAEGDTGLPR